MEISTNSTNASTGLRFGLIAGLVYCLSLFVRYNFTSTNPITLGAVALLFYLGVLAVLVFCGLARRKEFGGYLELKDAFQTLFIAVLVAELVYAIFNFIYLTYIDPGYLDELKASIIAFIEDMSIDEDKKQQQIEDIEKSFAKQIDRSSGMGLVFSYLISVAITGICALIIALIIRRKKPVFDQTM